MSLEHQKSVCSDFFTGTQKKLCHFIERLERQQNPSSAAGFTFTPWRREGGGGGIMGLMRAEFFEKAAIHFSCVNGRLPESFRKEVKGADKDGNFFATGLSLIIHPYNPPVPAIHFNMRFIVTTESWFGGALDLNPMLAAYRTHQHSDSVYFHDCLKKLCQQHRCADYDAFSKKCEEYFWIAHRSEPRGVGGIFYDHLNSGDFNIELDFNKQLSESFCNIYQNIVTRNAKIDFSPEDKQHQLQQRARYAEFNLIYDKGTRFGLKTGGNIEAILSSLPPLACWR